eukprot:775388-Pyramimonas_sp.AAC.1
MRRAASSASGCRHRRQSSRTTPPTVPPGFRRARKGAKTAPGIPRLHGISRTRSRRPQRGGEAPIQESSRLAPPTDRVPARLFRNAI